MASEAWWQRLGDSSCGAAVSEDGLYRTMLWRAFDGTKSPLVGCLLNPSTADANVDDPTVRRFCGFARREGAGGVIIVNLSPWRATDPRDLEQAYREGKDVLWTERNRDAIEAAWRISGKFVLAWGAGIRPWMEPAAFMVRQIAKPRYCLGKTKMGEPRHPLYLPNNAALEVYP